MLGVLDILGIIFIILKLCGVITWSWWWVCAPILVSLAIGFVIGIVAQTLSNNQTHYC